MPNVYYSGGHRFDGTRKIDLSTINPSYHNGLDRAEAEQITSNLAAELSELEDLLFYARGHSFLIILQGMDTSGKDGAIRHLMSVLNVQSARTASFKVPTEDELAHDFLWRVHAQTPPLGGLTIFNRSHYEDVVVVRVHDLVPKEVWSGRYHHINAFEKLLADSRTILLKVFLHISKEEQEERLLDREKELDKAWKLSVGDWRERERWGDYQEAWQDALNNCSTASAPWHVVPANHKWYRNLVITEAAVLALRPHVDEWRASLSTLGSAAKAELESYRQKDAT